MVLPAGADPTHVPEGSQHLALVHIVRLEELRTGPAPFNGFQRVEKTKARQGCAEITGRTPLCRRVTVHQPGSELTTWLHTLSRQVVAETPQWKRLPNLVISPAACR